MLRLARSAGLLAALSWAGSACSTPAAHQETLCSPERFTDALGAEVYSFECTPPAPGAEYSLSFDEGARRLVCLPAKDYAALKDPRKECR